MDDFCKGILEDTNLGSYTTVFEENKITRNHLQFLIDNENYLQRLIGDFGDRISFASCATKKLQETENSSGGSRGSGPSEDRLSTSTITGSQSNSIVLMTIGSSDIGEIQEVREIEEVIQTDFVDTEARLVVSTPIPDVDISLPSSKRQRTESVLRSKLSKSILGLALLASFDLKKSFDNSNRTKLANVIICEEFGLNSSTEISATRFKELAAGIREEFPGEDERIWYTPSVTRDNKTAIPKGKLYDQYTSICKELRDAGLRASRKGKADCVTFTSRRGQPPLPECNLSEAEIEKRLDFLKENIDNWELIVDNWTKTIRKRQSDLRSDSDTTDKENSFTFTYISQYPALKQSLGHTLLEIDFKSLYPAAHGRIFSEWEAFLAKLKKQLDIESVKYSGFISDAEWLHAFAGLFSSVPIKVPKGKAWKPAKTEILDGFLLHLKDINDLQKTFDYISKRNKAKGLSVQPFPAIVGKTLKTITQSYFIIDGKPLLLESPRHAVAYAFYAYHALYTNYPTQSARVWVVLERALFGVEDPNDTISEEIASFPEVRRLILNLKV